MISISSTGPTEPASIQAARDKSNTSPIPPRMKSEVMRAIIERLGYELTVARSGEFSTRETKV